MTSVSLRPATLADVPGLTQLVQAAYGHYVERIGGVPGPLTDDYAEVVRTRRVTVAQRAGEIVGLIVLELSDRALVIDNVAVDPTHQGSGVGRTLLEHAEATARAAGLAWIHLWTHQLMTENLALYSRIGYTKYDPGQRRDARLVYLRKKLT